MKLNIIVIDDEQPARRLLENYISKIDFLHLLGSFKSPLSALPILKEQNVDILLLDIRMPEISGLDFLKTLDTFPAVILTTAYREYALDGYEYDVTDYLLKPVEFTRFVKAINKVQKKVKTVSNNFSESSKKVQPSMFIYLKHNKKTCKISLSDILFIKGENEYVTYYIKNRDKLLIYATLKDIEKELMPSQFCRIHRSYIVNLNAIDFVEGNRVVIQDEKLPISETYNKAFFKTWKQIF